MRGTAIDKKNNIRVFRFLFFSFLLLAPRQVVYIFYSLYYNDAKKIFQLRRRRSTNYRDKPRYSNAGSLISVLQVSNLRFLRTLHVGIGTILYYHIDYNITVN